MSHADELNKLADLHARGALSDDEYARAKERVLNGPSTAGTYSGSSSGDGMDAVNSLRRSRDDRWIGGVCGGIGRTTGMASWIWRLLFTLLVLCAGSGVLLYVLLWIFVPEE
ncbi:PspC domain-containing protein [Paucibacter sp. R3-3]|uniref:PspC domain-containing protein n=1 Tax=Roseateles agri TaxID=3098619 RepID=A0ABU5DL16_9BURK|nr:PspC domain-containing protein [Paucibacter sp. R3-3]MDY0747005.1 PspC domain-containing protein [Paucibacter sp. R3-3]